VYIAATEEVECVTTDNFRGGSRGVHRERGVGNGPKSSSKFQILKYEGPYFIFQKYEGPYFNFQTSVKFSNLS